MAEKEKQATCPVCGYTDTALDAGALQGAMAEHMRSAHNMDMPATPTDTDMKETGRRGGDWAAPAIPIAPGTTGGLPTTAVPPGNNVGTNEIP